MEYWGLFTATGLFCPWVSLTRYVRTRNQASSGVQARDVLVAALVRTLNDAALLRLPGSVLREAPCCARGSAEELPCVWPPDLPGGPRRP